MKADLRWKLDDWHAHSGSKLDLEELRRSFEDMVESIGYKEDDSMDYEDQISSLESERDMLQDELDDAN